MYRDIVKPLNMSFLTAEWRKLVLANYIIEPAVLEDYVPRGTELDLWNNNCYASLVGFMFMNTKLLGIPIPFHRNFEEVNLRFYVRYKEDGEWKRGVVFIKEIVPKPALTFVANTIYGEHYQTMPMDHKWEELTNKRQVEYRWKYRDKWHFIKLDADLKSSNIEPGSEEEFITEHYWGYTKISSNTTYEYQVTHPKWEVYKVLDHEIDVDFGVIYGQEFAGLSNRTPNSIMLAEGSKITVENKRKI